MVDDAGNLYIGGDFTLVGNVLANRIAKWNGSSWSRLGSGLWGNDDYSANAALQNEIDVYRDQLLGTGNDELGFAVSPDGSTWVLLIRPRLERNCTLAAKVFQLEMLKSFLDDIVCSQRPAFAFSDAQEGSRPVKEYHPAK